MKISTKQIREKKPIVQCITNPVTTNDCANILLALGAAPIMAHHVAEVAEVSKNCDALVCNFGAIEDFEAMKIAAQTAVSYGHPVVIDPVGVGGITYRRNKFFELIQVAKPTCIRGNMSEIYALYGGHQTAKGVDVSEETIDDRKMADIVRKLSQQLGCIVVASGAVDLISDGEAINRVTEGDEMMTRITGAGCMSSVVLATFFSCYKGLEAATMACTLMGKCGEIAAADTKAVHKGTMSFRLKLIDEISCFDEG